MGMVGSVMAAAATSNRAVAALSLMRSGAKSMGWSKIDRLRGGVEQLDPLGLIVGARPVEKDLGDEQALGGVENATREVEPGRAGHGRQSIRHHTKFKIA
jgi:hypothetical protein